VVVVDLDLFHQWQVENPRRNRPVELVLHDLDLSKRLALAKLFRDWSDEEILYQDQRLQPTSFAQIARNEPCEMIGRHVQLSEHYQASSHSERSHRHECVSTPQA
jgi:fructose-1,6-bisphosphatase